MRSLKHTRHRASNAGCRHSAHSLGSRAWSPTMSLQKGDKLAGFREDGLKVVGAAYAASREQWVPPRLGRFQVNTPRGGQVGEGERGRGGPEQLRRRTRAPEARLAPRRPLGEAWTPAPRSPRRAIPPTRHPTPPRTHTAGGVTAPASITRSPPPPPSGEKGERRENGRKGGRGTELRIAEKSRPRRDPRARKAQSGGGEEPWERPRPRRRRRAARPL